MIMKLKTSFDQKSQLLKTNEIIESEILGGNEEEKRNLMIKMIK